MAERTPKPPGAGEMPDMTELWRTWMSESERQWNDFLNKSMATDEYSMQLGRFMDVYLFNLKNVSEVMGRFFMAVNMPTRTDVLELGERLLEIEARLATIEAGLTSLSTDPTSAKRAAPPRTKTYADA